MDSELEAIINKLMKKGLDTNSFISEEVKKCLISICYSCTDNRIVQILLTHSNAKPLQIKLNITLCIE